MNGYGLVNTLVVWFVGGELLYIIMADDDFTTIHYVSISSL